MSDSRADALKIFTDILTSAPAIGSAPSDNAAFIHMLVRTALRHMTYITSILRKFASPKILKQHNTTKYALLLGAAELLYMKSPAYAVINSYVGLVKKSQNRFAAGFVNAVLRKINSAKSELLAADTNEFFPPRFRSLLLQDYSPEVVARIEQSSMLEPLLDVTLFHRDSLLSSMGKILPLGTLRFKSQGKISELPDYNAGTWQVQDFSSSLPVKMLSDLRSKRVLDVCAAPGGKTAQLLAQGAKVTALDISSPRLAILRENLDRLHLSPQEVICADAIDYFTQTSDMYDIILLDAPCSATGTLRRHPEVAHLKTAADITKQAALQQRLLDLSASHIVPSGILLYCTCSLCSLEGEKQILSFLDEHPEFRTVSLAPKIPLTLTSIISPQGFLRILPHHLSEFGGADGFFIAKLERRA